jgi:3-hydroxyacyl-CoA dehydrogenase / enoyl-CoA hydratase / 3-hydroxybutyryl-CoA epimerase
MNIQRAAVVGAGAMGGGIAYLFSAAGIPVIVKDIEPRQLDLAREHLQQIYQRRVDRGQLDLDTMQQGVKRVSYTLSYAAFSELDLVIEAVPEDMQIKAGVFRELGSVCPPRAILASNTSALSITEMGRASGRPHNVLGMHFFNPAHVMKLVEIIPGSETKDDVVNVIDDLARRLGKEPVIVGECPGFLVNRVLMPYLNEAAICLQERAASVSEIDAALGPDGFGWPMGPFTLMDMLGLDVCHHIMAYLDTHYGERLQEAAILRRLVQAGRLGQKGERGFYEYPGRVPSAEVDRIRRELLASGQVDHPASAFSVHRTILPLVNEAFLCLEEGIAGRDAIDKACTMGLGMAVRLGEERVPMGPIAYAEQVGLGQVLRSMLDLERTLGRRFRPAPILGREAAQRPGSARGDLGSEEAK